MKIYQAWQWAGLLEMRWQQELELSQNQVKLRFIFIYFRNIGTWFMQRWQIYSTSFWWCLGIPLKWRCRIDSTAIFWKKKRWGCCWGTCERKLSKMDTGRRWYYWRYNLCYNIFGCETPLTITNLMIIRMTEDYSNY